MNKVPIPLYHGTDLRIAKMSIKERFSMRNLIEDILNFIWPFYAPFYDDSHLGEYKLFKALKSDETLWFNVYDKMQCWGLCKKGHHQYQYQREIMYVTSQKQTASSHARRGFYFGEIGAVAYTLLKGVSFLVPIESFPSDITSKIEEFLSFIEEDKHPVVFKLENLDLSKLLNWKEEPLSDFELSYLDSQNGLIYNDKVELLSYPFENVEVFSSILYDKDNPYKTEWESVKKDPEWRDYVRIIKDCGGMPAIGEICNVGKVCEKEISVIPNHHKDYFTIPLDSVEVVKKIKNR